MEKIKIYKFQLEQIYTALRLTANAYDCRDKKTCLDRQVASAEQFALNALNKDIDKEVDYI